MSLQALGVLSDGGMLDSVYGTAKIKVLGVGVLSLPSRRMVVCGPEAIGAPEFRRAKMWDAGSQRISVSAYLLTDSAAKTHLGMLEFSPHGLKLGAHVDWARHTGPVYVEHAHQDIFTDSATIVTIEALLLEQDDLYWEAIQERLSEIGESEAKFAFENVTAGNEQVLLLVDSNDEVGMIAAYSSTDGRLRVVYRAAMTEAELKQIRKQ